MVDESDGTVEVCLVKTGETMLDLQVHISAGNFSPVESEGMPS